MMDKEQPNGLYDYKIMCFEGEPEYIQLHKNRFLNHTQDLYDKEMNKLPIRQGMNVSDEVICKTDYIEKMIELSKILADNIQQVRIDWYYANGHIYFGEITFFDGSGYYEFEPDKYNYIFGSLINLGDHR